MDRTLSCYIYSLQQVESVLFFGFSISSIILKVAEYAVELNKKIACVPGDISNFSCSGSNFLLKTGNALFVDDLSEIERL